MNFKENINQLHISFKEGAKLIYAQPEGDQLAIDVVYNGIKYGGYLPKIK